MNDRCWVRDVVLGTERGGGDDDRQEPRPGTAPTIASQVQTLAPMAKGVNKVGAESSQAQRSSSDCVLGRHWLPPRSPSMHPCICVTPTLLGPCPADAGPLDHGSARRHAVCAQVRPPRSGRAARAIASCEGFERGPGARWWPAAFPPRREPGCLWHSPAELQLELGIIEWSNLLPRVVRRALGAQKPKQCRTPAACIRPSWEERVSAPSGAVARGTAMARRRRRRVVDSAHRFEERSSTEPRGVSQLSFGGVARSSRAECACWTCQGRSVTRTHMFDMSTMSLQITCAIIPRLAIPSTTEDSRSCCRWDQLRGG